MVLEVAPAGREVVVTKKGQRWSGASAHADCSPASLQAACGALYEWQRRGSAKQPFCFEVGDGGLFAFGGLWERWRDPSGQWLKTCSILTTTPNAVTSAIHNRMPVILDPDNYDSWLDPGMTNVQVVSELLKPYDARLMRCYPVSTRINHVANDDEECSRPVEVVETQDRLFL